jgi:hypothetical protein
MLTQQLLKIYEVQYLFSVDGASWMAMNLQVPNNLGVDQRLELKVITADGDLKVANTVSNPDLLWAI